jgi:uncharacterized protein YwbE
MSDFRFKAWPTEFRTINQHFGANPQNYAQFGLAGHEGVDIMAPHGSKIFAVAAGTVTLVHTNPNSHNYGIHVRLDHGNGYRTIYAHLQQAGVRTAQRVAAGDLLGLADNTGNSFGSHLHITLKKRGANVPGYLQDFIDPTPYLLPLMGWQRPAGPYISGWAYTAGIIINDDLAQANTGGINLRAQPSVNAAQINLVPGGTIMIVTGSNQGLYTPVNVPRVALPGGQTPPPPPGPPPPPTVNTVDGWGFASNLTVTGNQAVVGQFGINLRATPNRDGLNIGLVAASSTVTVRGAQSGEYLPVRVRRTDFSGPVNIPDQPEPPPPPTPGEPADPDNYTGWAWTPYLEIDGRQALVGRFGINLRSGPNQNSQNIGLAKGGATVTIIGQPSGEYTPVRIHKQDVLNAASPMPAITSFQPLPEPDSPPPPPEQPIHDTTPGWAFTTAVEIRGNQALTNEYGINLRDAPRRDAQNIGFVPDNTTIIVTGPAQGEYTPVRVDDTILQPPFDPSKPPDTTVTPPASDPEPTPMGNAHIGLHASADPDISQAEIDTFRTMRPGMIKVLSFHNPDAVRQLAQNHPDAHWVVRAFLAFGNRNLSPQQFFDFTISDMHRTLNLLPRERTVIELHNEPNLSMEGLGSAWQDGASFSRWWLQLLALYRRELPGMRFIYPGLSPGHDVMNIKQDHIRFIEASREAVEAADGLGVHIYWSNVYPMETALGVLDDYIARFRYKPIWVTEASNNKAGTPTWRKGEQYLKCWQELQTRPTVQGVTYFVASASDPTFAEEIWVGRGIAEVVGRR